MDTDERIVWIDWLRVTALFLVLLTHSCEPFYLGGEGSLILTRTDAVWVALLNVIPRACVSLFVVASSYLLFPLRYPAGEFFRRRASRILIPFIFWTLVYAVVSGNPAENFKTLPFNFCYSAGHLWFVYMLIGVYLLMPLLSPWAEKVGKKELQAYLGIWLFTTVIPLVRQALGGNEPVMYGLSGTPMTARFPLWGECSWNPYGVFYYVSGFIGYLFLGLYFRKFVGELSWAKTLSVAAPLFLAGFALCSFGFLRNVAADAGGVFPVEGPVALAAHWEAPWLNDTFGVALMAIAWILVFRKIKARGRFYGRVLLPVSRASYGMYLCHMLVLGPVSALIRSLLGTGSAGVLGIWTTPAEMLSTALLSFCIVALACLLLQKIPKVGKWIMG